MSISHEQRLKNLQKLLHWSTSQSDGLGNASLQMSEADRNFLTQALEANQPMDESAEIRKLSKVFFLKSSETTSSSTSSSSEENKNGHGLSGEELLELKMESIDVLLDLLSPIDNAKNFVKNMNGVHVIRHLLSVNEQEPEEDLIAGGLDILATVCQNNPEPQSLLLKEYPECMYRLVELANPASSENFVSNNCARKALTAISSLTSSNPEARFALLGKDEDLSKAFLETIQCHISLSVSPITNENEESNPTTAMSSGNNKLLKAQFRLRKKALFMLPHMLLRDATSKLKVPALLILFRESGVVESIAQLLAKTFDGTANTHHATHSDGGMNLISKVTMSNFQQYMTKTLVNGLDLTNAIMYNMVTGANAEEELEDNESQTDPNGVIDDCRTELFYAALAMLQQNDFEGRKNIHILEEALSNSLLVFNSNTSSPPSTEGENQQGSSFLHGSGVYPCLEKILSSRMLQLRCLYFKEKEEEGEASAAGSTLPGTGSHTSDDDNENSLSFDDDEEFIALKEFYTKLLEENNSLDQSSIGGGQSQGSVLLLDDALPHHNL